MSKSKVKTSKMFFYYAKFAWSCFHCGFFNVHEIDSHDGKSLNEILDDRPQMLECLQCKRISKGIIDFHMPFGKFNRKTKYWEKFKAIAKRYAAKFKSKEKKNGLRSEKRIPDRSERKARRKNKLRSKYKT